MSDEQIVKHVMVDGKLDQSKLKEVSDWIKAREDTIQEAVNNPLESGFIFPSWRKVLDMIDKWMEVFAFGGNGSSKSECLAWLTALAVKHNPGAIIWLFSQDDKASVNIQQKLVDKYLRARFGSQHKTTSGGYFKYSPANGYTDNRAFFDYEDGTEFRQVHFGTYSQYESNKAKFEGYEYGSRTPGLINIPESKFSYAGLDLVVPSWEGEINMGCAFDEYLENGDMYNTITYRLPRRGSFVFNGFTPINHMTPFVSGKIKGSMVVEKIKTNPKIFDSSKGEPSEVEWVREKRNNPGKKAGVGMVYFPSGHNPWAGEDNMIILHGHKTLKERLVRFHGIPGDVITSLFPKFSLDLNVMTEDEPNCIGMKFPDISDASKFTTWHIVDPADNRNDFMLWGAADANGNIFIRREWPDRETYGEWAEFGDPRWKPGPATKKQQLGIQGYIDLYQEIEDEIGVKPFERVGDSRFFAHSHRQGEDVMDLFDQFADKGCYFVPSDGRKEEIGIRELDEWFDWNDNIEPDATNKPRVYIHASCGNLIESILTYERRGKFDEALKDPIDNLRYLRMVNAGEGPEHYNQDAFKQTYKTGGY
jgi:hypothetical protein